MVQLRLGYPTRLLQGGLRERIRVAGSFGANGIQFDLRNELRASELTETGRRQLRHVLDENGLAFAPPVFPLRRALAEEEGLEERVAGVKGALRFAATLGSSLLIVRPGPLPAGDTSDRPLFLELLNDLARAGDHVGVTLALTTSRDSPAELVDVLSSVTAGPIGVNFDPAASVMSGGDPAAAIRLLHSYVRHIRVRDGLRDAEEAGIEVSVGRGDVDWDELLASVVEIGYDGWFTPDRTTGSNPASDAARAISFVKNVMPF